MSKIKAKTLAQFEQVHAQPKIAALNKSLEIERAKVEALASVQNQIIIEERRDCCIRFGLTGDRHHGSLYQHADALHAYYDYVAAQDIDVVYDCGDILDGHRIYKGQEFELRDIGAEAQIARLAKDGRFADVRTRFITGNHDASFKHAAGVCVGKMIEQSVDGYEFLGEEQATVRFDTPNGGYTLGLIHPGGGSSYALSYRPQKIIESISGGHKPNMLAIGHYHKAEQMPTYRNVCGIQAGTFQRQTPFMARQGLAAHVGGWVIEINVGCGLNRIKAEFVAFYV
jgi:hypothetical protein